MKPNDIHAGKTYVGKDGKGRMAVDIFGGRVTWHPVKQDYRGRWVSWCSIWTFARWAKDEVKA
jgi:hypothetical protein